jgi:hypothetical protein
MVFVFERGFGYWPASTYSQFCWMCSHTAGFFVCKLKKMSNRKKEEAQEENEEDKQVRQAVVLAHTPQHE